MCVEVGAGVRGRRGGRREVGRREEGEGERRGQELHCERKVVKIFLQILIGTSWSSNTANLCETVVTSSCITCLAGVCELCFARPLSPATLPKEQPRWHTAADKPHCHCQSRPSPTLLLAGRKIGPCRTLCWGPWSSSIKNVVFFFLNMSVAWLVSLSPGRFPDCVDMPSPGRRQDPLGNCAVEHRTRPEHERRLVRCERRGSR